MVQVEWQEITGSLMSGHDGWLAGEVGGLLMLVLLGATVAVILVALVPRNRRVEAIRAVADLLSALFPWPGRRSGR
jgi:hypothetical protein